MARNKNKLKHSLSVDMRTTLSVSELIPNDVRCGYRQPQQLLICMSYNLMIFEIVSNASGEKKMVELICCFTS